MLQKIIILCFVCACSATATYSQELRRQDRSKFVVVPPEQVLLTIAAQPGCPLQFEEVKYLAGVDGGGSPSFLVRNKSVKPIRSFTVGGTDWTISWPNEFTKRLLMPGERAAADDDVEIVNLSNELRDKLNLRGAMRSILVLMVVKVEFADGSNFSNESTYQALQEYSEKLSELSSRKPR